MCPRATDYHSASCSLYSYLWIVPIPFLKTGKEDFYWLSEQKSNLAPSYLLALGQCSSGSGVGMGL